MVGKEETKCWVRLKTDADLGGFNAEIRAPVAAGQISNKPVLCSRDIKQLSLT